MLSKRSFKVRYRYTNTHVITQRLIWIFSHAISVPGLHQIQKRLRFCSRSLFHWLSGNQAPITIMLTRLLTHTWPALSCGSIIGIVTFHQQSSLAMKEIPSETWTLTSDRHKCVCVFQGIILMGRRLLLLLFALGSWGQGCFATKFFFVCVSLCVHTYSMFVYEMFQLPICYSAAVSLSAPCYQTALLQTTYGICLRV